MTDSFAQNSIYMVMVKFFIFRNLIYIFGYFGLSLGHSSDLAADITAAVYTRDMYFFIFP